jgi:hypothetical protein
MTAWLQSQACKEETQRIVDEKIPLFLCRNGKIEPYNMREAIEIAGRRIISSVSGSAKSLLKATGLTK